jgi:hypothetical protein
MLQPGFGRRLVSGLLLELVPPSCGFLGCAHEMLNEICVRYRELCFDS